MRTPKKRPTIGETPQPKKRPKWSDHEIEGRPLAWRFSTCDRDGPFSWSTAEKEGAYLEVLNRLEEFESKSWEQIIAAGSHLIEIHSLHKPARDRLAKIEQDDIDELMSFRLTGAKRVWCIKDENIMRVLWWDPEHKVCPVERDKADQRKRNRRKGR